MKKAIFGFILCLFSISAFAQDITVQGVVVSETDGMPVIGAAVIPTDYLSEGTATDLDGHFTLNVPSKTSVTVSCIGYKTVTVPVSASMKIVLEEDALMMDELVVTGYTSQRKVDLTGSVAVVSTDDLKTSHDSDPMRALQGKVPGMTITMDGSPSGTATVRIRGIGSFNSSQDPLYVIDGIPTNQTLNSLNVNDIESMQVLKDAASASIYGSRAANGVIIITTKKGKNKEKIDVNFSANVTAQFYTNQSTMDLLNTPEYATAMAQAALNDGLDPVQYAENFGLNLNAENGYAIQAYNPATSTYDAFTVNGLYDGYINAKKTMRISNTDWLNEMARTGFAQNYDLSLAQATDKSSAMFSLGYKNNEGILKHTDFENISARMNTSFTPVKWLTIGENMTVTYTNQVNSFPMENALKMSSIVPVYEEDGETFAGPVGGMSDRQNPVRELYHNKDNRLYVWRIFGNAYVDLKPVKGLVLRSNFGLDFDGAFIRSLAYTYHSDIVNNDIPKSTLNQTNKTRWTWTNTANYDFKVADEHTFNILAGMEMFKENAQYMSAYAEGFVLENIDYMWPDAATGIEKATGSQDGYSLISFFGKVDYNWKDLILASVTLRHDGSSRFGANNRFATFPAATLGYRLSQHIDAEWLDELKLRASWGKTGNQAISNLARFSLFYADYGSGRDTATSYDLYLQGSGTFPSGFRTGQSANNNLKWETTTQYNAGLDFAFFNSSLYGSADAYIKDITDMLISPAYLGCLGEGGSSWLNGPSLRNVGMELSLGYKNVTASGFSYDIHGNLDFFRNKVTYLPATTTGSYEHTTKQNLVEAGVPYGSLVGYVVDGLFQNHDEVLASGQENARVGGLKYADLDGNGKINADDQTWILNPVPNFSYGLNVSLGYKGLDLTMFWQGVQGVEVYNNQKFQTDFWSLTDAGSNKGSRLLDAWTTDNTSSMIPALTTNNTGDEGRRSTYFVENGSYLKLRDLSIGYSLPTKVLEKAKITKTRFYVSGHNLLTLKSKSLTCKDPENPNWAYPLATSVTFGVQIGF